jgi:ADP-ribosylglycohydrolase
VDTAFADSALGCLLRGGVGDGSGYEVEFDSVAVIRVEFGDQGFQEPSLYHGRLVISDDTQMTLFTLGAYFGRMRYTRQAQLRRFPRSSSTTPSLRMVGPSMNEAAGPRSAVFLKLGQSSQTDEANILA